MTGHSYSAIVGRIIRLHRELLGISLDEMAKRVHLKSPSGWSRVETGDTPITIDRLYEAAKILKTTSTQLLKEADGIEASIK
jgi:transcriptional regulator with XRE-family HTH domain